MLNRMDRRLVRCLPVLLWMGVIFYMSAQPDLPHHPDDKVDVIIKKLGHMAEYGILAALVWWASSKGGDTGSRRVFLFALVVSGLYAISDEFHQFFVPGRDGQLLDVAFDLLGALLILLLLKSLTRLVGRREPQ